MLRSFCEIIKHAPNTRLIIAGSSVSLDIYNQILEISREAISQISFCGLIPHTEIGDWYAIADIGVMPSYVEPFGYTGMEMLMYGLPIVSSDGFGVRNMFSDGVNAKIAKIGYSEEEYENNLTEAILELLDSKSMCETLSKNARITYESRYRINYMCSKYNELIKNI